MIEKKLVPPDGGYGWVVVGAVSFHHFISFSMTQIFGLMFKDLFIELGFSAVDISFIMNTNSALSLGMGLVNGILVRSFGYRKVALFGSTLLITGVILTANANSFTQYVISYGVITALGAGMTLTSHAYSLNNYFSKKLAKAVSYAFTICGFGPLLMPLLFSFLIDVYGAKGSALLLGGIVAHILATSLLLQPIKWHMKEELVEEANECKNLLQQENENIECSKETKATLPTKDDLHYQSTCELDNPLGASLLSLYNDAKRGRRSSHISANSLTVAVCLEDEKSDKIKMPKEVVMKDKEISKSQHIDLNIKKDEEHIPLIKRIGIHIVKIFDLELLKDSTFLNMSIGMSIAAVAEINFGQLTPFIMNDFGLNTQQIATFLSVQAVTDICFRFIAPYVSDWCKQPVRVMYLWSLVLIILSRCSLLFTNDYYPLLGCAVFLGTAKGFRMIYWTLVIPSYVSIERLPAAGGIQSIFNSVLMWTGGPFIGFIRGKIGSPSKCIIVINMVSAICLIMWTIEFVYKHYMSKAKEIKEQNLEI